MTVAERLRHEIGKYFVTQSEWPLLRTMQKKFVNDGNVRRMALELPDHVQCEDANRATAICYLTLEGLAEVPEAASDLEHFLAACRIIGARALDVDGEATYSSWEIARRLGLGGSDARRLGELLYRVGRLWSSAMHGNAGDYEFTAHLDAWYYAEVNSVADYLAARERVSNDTAALAKAHFENLWGQATAPGAERKDANPRNTRDLVVGPFDLEPLARIEDEGLRAVLISDARELQSLVEAQSWKAVAVLAGGCCEGALVGIIAPAVADDVIDLPSGWDGWGLHDLAEAAYEHGLISQFSSDAANVMRKWRNLIHPVRASRSDRPTEQIAWVLLSFLSFLVGELRATRSMPARNDV